VPAWLGQRTTCLGAVIVKAILLEHERDELRRRLAHLFWFQFFGAVMEMDWHSSGITTSAQKRRLAPLFELAVFAASAIEPDVRRTAITSRLTRNAGSDSGKRTAARFRDFVTAFHAVGLSFTRRHARPRPHHFVRNAIVDLILYSSVWSPPVRHCCYPIFVKPEELHMETATTVSKPIRAGQED